MRLPETVKTHRISIKKDKAVFGNRATKSLVTSPLPVAVSNRPKPIITICETKIGGHGY